MAERGITRTVNKNRVLSPLLYTNRFMQVKAPAKLRPIKTSLNNEEGNEINSDQSLAKQTKT